MRIIIGLDCNHSQPFQRAHQHGLLTKKNEGLIIFNFIKMINITNEGVQDRYRGHGATFLLRRNTHTNSGCNINLEYFLEAFIIKFIER
jgi:hypothetical protein